MKPTIRRATVDDALYLAHRLRPADARELQAAHPHSTVMDALFTAVKADGEAYVLSFGNEPPCVLFGVAHVELGIGTIWMVCTPEIKGRAISILREARHWIQYWKHEYSLLANYVETRNDMAVAWLALLGARFGSPEFRNGVRVRLFNL